jgi:type IV secretion system protein VirB3
MFLGVPMVPFMVVTGLLLLLALWSIYLVSAYVSLFLALLYAPLIVTMRQITKQDDQRLRQVLMRLRMRHRHFNRALWGAVSYSPLRFKRRT